MTPCSSSFSMGGRGRNSDSNAPTWEQQNKATLDNDESYVYDRQTGALAKGDQNLETTARQAAVAAISKAAEEDGILELAQQNAETYLARFFAALGYPDAVFEPVAPD